MARSREPRNPPKRRCRPQVTSILAGDRREAEYCRRKAICLACEFWDAAIPGCKIVDQRFDDPAKETKQKSTMATAVSPAWAKRRNGNAHRAGRQSPGSSTLVMKCVSVNRAAHANAGHGLLSRLKSVALPLEQTDQRENARFSIVRINRANVALVSVFIIDDDLTDVDRQIFTVVNAQLVHVRPACDIRRWRSGVDG